MESYRFVVAIREEKSSTRITSRNWRGWVERVYPSTPVEGAARLWFQNIEEVSPLIAVMIEQREEPDGSGD